MKLKRFISRYLLYLMTFFLLCLADSAKAQKYAVKTNLPVDFTATLNLGVEMKVAPKWSVDVSGNLNAWGATAEKRWKQWLIQPELRYWLCDVYSRHFFGVHLLYGSFNFGGIKNNISFFGTDFSVLSDMRYQGYAYGGGISYGYSFMLGKHWNLEPEIGFGYLFLDYEKFNCAGCGRKTGEGTHHYVGPTKAAVNLIYLF